MGRLKPKKLTKIKYPSARTRRPISSGAEKWLGVPIRCLDHGFIYLVDYMGDDGAIEQAARVSYGGGTRKVSETRGLVRYLRRHAHTTPFEMVEVKFHAKMPIFVARQWVRHRTANINEYSARYSILDEEFYIPEPGVLAEQSFSNKQGREKAVPEEYAKYVRKLLINDAVRLYQHYDEMLNDDGLGNPKIAFKPRIARELARMDLSLNYYTQWYWKIDLHNLMHFCKLRMDPHAQYEIKVFADAMAQIMKDAFPIAWEAFEDYELHAIKLTRIEQQILSNLLKAKAKFTPKEVLKVADEIGLENKRERNEALEKLIRLGFVSS